jgi:hypothetical protein
LPKKKSFSDFLKILLSFIFIVSLEYAIWKGKYSGGKGTGWNTPAFDVDR